MFDWPLILSPGQTIATFQRNTSQHCWAHMLRALGHQVATCCDMLGVVGSNSKMVKFSMQHLWILHDVVVFGQVCPTMLRLGMRTTLIFNSQHVATRYNRVAKRVQHVAPTMLRSVAFKCCNRLAEACKYWANNVGLCCIEMLRSFGWGFIGYLPIADAIHPLLKQFSNRCEDQPS